MLDIGRLCIKTAGKDAGKTVVVVDTMDDNFVLIDGPVKRKRCNILHLEPTPKLITLKKNAPHAEVAKEFKKLNIDMPEKKKKTQKGERPRKQRKKKEQQQAQQKDVQQTKEKKEAEKPEPKAAAGKKAKK